MHLSLRTPNVFLIFFCSQWGVKADDSDRYANRFCSGKDYKDKNWIDDTSEYDVMWTFKENVGKKLCDNDGMNLTPKGTVGSIFPYSQ